MIESLTQVGRDRSLDHKISRLHFAKGSWGAKVIDAVYPQDLNSPLTILAEKRKEDAQNDLLRHFLEGMALALDSTADEIVRAHFEQAADFLVDPRKRIPCLGDRFSGHLAAILRWHLQQLRPALEMLAEPEVELADRLVDVGARDVLVVCDFRRYQENVVFFATEAHARGCKTILFTDKWLSPIAESADIVFPSRSNRPLPSTPWCRPSP